MPLLHGLKKVTLGKKLFFFGGDVYFIKPVTVLDVLGEAEGLPLCFLKKQDSAGTVYDNVKADSTNGKKENEQMVKTLRFFLKNGVVLKNGAEFDVDAALLEKFSEKTLKKLLALFGHVVSISFKLFFKEVSITSININSIYILASKYGCRPIDIIAKKTEYTDLDAWMFDMFISGHGVKEEERQMKKQSRSARRGS
jgi:hypothetical protein